MGDRMITVCAECLQASCWQAIFMCDRSQTANITQRTEEELAVLGREHPDYWLTDAEVAKGIRPGRQERTFERKLALLSTPTDPPRDAPKEGM